MAALRRRRVLRAVLVWAVVAWALVAVAEAALPGLDLPDWLLHLLLVVVALGFPLALVLAWSFERGDQGRRPPRKRGGPGGGPGPSGG